MRCFVAINLPDSIKDYLEDVILGIEKSNPRLRIKWVEKENLHLTLGFIEHIDEMFITKLANNLSSMSLPKNLMLCLENLGVFPNIHKPRIVKINLLDTDKKLKLIAGQVKSIFQENNIPIDSRPFSPHITLGRIKTPSARLILRKVEPLCFEARSIDLMYSKLTAIGPIYRCLKSVKVNSSE